MNVFHYDRDGDGIVTVTMDMTGPVNAMNDEYVDAMEVTLERLAAEEGLSGVVLASAKTVFFAGGDLAELLRVEADDRAAFMARVEQIKGQLRRLERLPVPVVAAINGAALGGGYEICLACHYRIAVNQPPVVVGLPEVTLGLLPGSGGIVRLVNLLGLEAALPWLLEGRQVRPEQALASGLIDAVVDSQDALLPAAKRYLRVCSGRPDAAIQPWDRKGHRPPGGADPAQVALFSAPALRRKTRGLLPAPEEILDCAVQAARLDFDTALRVESRGLTHLVTTPEARNMITAFFFQMNKVRAGASRPPAPARGRVDRLGVVGAGMMGRGIACVSALAGIEVVLRDTTLENAERGKAHVGELLDRQVAGGRMDEGRRAAVLDLIRPAAGDGDLQGCDLIVEAVFEDIELKGRITRACEGYLAEEGVWGSNTSSLPISDLAQASRRPERFIGIHFFSPVDRMPLVEIICGEKTNDDTLARAFDFARQIGKTPIVVNDSLAFFTSRTFATYLDEGARLVSEGVHPVRTDNLGKAVGMPVGPLTAQDEVSLQLLHSAQMTAEAMGHRDKWGEQEAMRQVLDTLLVQHGRGGRHHGGGYYDYHEHGKAVWPGLLAAFYRADHVIADGDIGDRLLFRQVIETLKCLESGVLRSVADGNIGSLLGIGAPAHTGGFIQFVNGYGLQRFSDRCDELAARYGERFRAPAIVAEKLQAAELFS